MSLWENISMNVERKNLDYIRNKDKEAIRKYFISENDTIDIFDNNLIIVIMFYLERK